MRISNCLRAIAKIRFSNVVTSRFVRELVENLLSTALTVATGLFFLWGYWLGSSLQRSAHF